MKFSKIYADPFSHHYSSISTKENALKIVDVTNPEIINITIVFHSRLIASKIVISLIAFLNANLLLIFVALGRFTKYTKYAGLRKKIYAMKNFDAALRKWMELHFDKQSFQNS